jgi:Amt family ammonium transporter
VLAIGAWAIGLGFILFFSLKATVGLRVSRRIEEEGLDVYEHGESAYN